MADLIEHRSDKRYIVEEGTYFEFQPNPGDLLYHNGSFTVGGCYRMLLVDIYEFENDDAIFVDDDGDVFWRELISFVGAQEYAEGLQANE